MKQKLIAFFSLVTILFSVFSLTATPAARAQALPGDVLDIGTHQAVAFVKGDRSILYIKRPNAPVDAYDLAAIINDLYGATVIDSIRHLAVIGMTPDGGRLVLGAIVDYINPSNSLHESFAGIFQIPWPLTIDNITNDPLPSWFLCHAPDLGDFHPSGILSSNGSEWYAAMRTSSQGNEPMKFYHGHVDGSGPVDSAEITGDITGTDPPQSGWIMSNIALDTTNSTMVVAEVDALESFGNQAERYLIIRWHIGDPQPYAINISGDIKGMSGKIQFGIDSLFAVTVAPLQNSAQLELGLKNLNHTDNSIEFYKIRYNSIDQLSPTRTIPRSILPDSATFFAGINTSKYTPTYHDDNPSFHEHGQSGDVILSRDGNTVLFITHETPDNGNTTGKSPRNVKSAIYTYDFSEPKATLIYNDSTAQELQPLFVPVKDTTPHVPDIQASTTPLNFGTVDTGATSTRSVTITDPSMFAGTILDSARITGDNEFTIVSPKFPDTIQHNSSSSVQVLFSPVATPGARTATLKVYSSRSTTKSISIVLNGTAKVLPPNNGVEEDASLAQAMTIEPNPFSSATSVRLTAQDAGALGIVVHDALGRTVYTSALQHAGAGMSESFEFDAKSLGLPNGIYYVTALFGNREVSRQVVFVR